MNVNFQDPFSFITKLIDRLDGGKDQRLENALDLLKKGKPADATAILITLPKIDLALGCVVPDEDGNLVADERWIPEFVKAALAKAKTAPAKKPVEEEKKK